MQPLSAAQLLNIWEWGGTQSPAQRALALLAAACPDKTSEMLAELSVGRRDQHLLTLREWAFGSQCASVALCPCCGERLEMAFELEELRAQSVVHDSNSGQESGTKLSTTVDDYALSFRLPNTLDLAAISQQPDTGASTRALFERCLLSAEHKGEAATPSELPDELVAAVSARMAEADPQADVQLALHCSSCGHRWQLLFDIVSFFWREIEEWAQRIVREVHTLASVYGWREMEILALSPTRRRIYLELIGDA